MDPKTANLDPKLREAYERIMGTNAQTSVVKPVESTPAAQAPKLQVQEVAPEPLNIPKVEPSPPPPPPETPSNEMVQSPVFNATKSPFSQPLPPPADILGKNTNTILNSASTKKKGKLVSIVLTLGGLGFFVLYGLVWAKLFGLF